MEHSVAVFAEWPTEKLHKEKLLFESLKNNKSISPHPQECKNAKINLNSEPSKCDNAENVQPKDTFNCAKTNELNETSQYYQLSKKVNSRPQRALKENDSTPGIVFKLFPSKVVSEIAPQNHKPAKPSLFGLKENQCIDLLSSVYSQSQYLCIKDAESNQIKTLKSCNHFLNHHHDYGQTNHNCNSNHNDPMRKEYFYDDGSKSERNKINNHNSGCAYPATYSSSMHYRKGLYDKNHANHSLMRSSLKAISRRISASGPVEGRACGSCNVMKTPYWRDGWDQSIMLCNACGLRYQKFKKRCSFCKYVPRKEDGECPRCTQCNNSWI